MSERDRKILAFSLPAVGLLLALLLIPMLLQKLGKAEIQTEELEGQRSTLVRLRSSYLKLHPKGTNAEPTPKGDGQGCGPGPLAFFGEMARQSGIRDKVVEMKPREETGGRQSISVRLERVMLGSLTDMIDRIEKSPQNFRVDSLSIKPLPLDRNLLEIQLVASCL